jgi:hypothetical protein
MPLAVIVETEIDTPGGWEFGVRVTQRGKADRNLTLRMSWADSEHWSGGASAPSIVAQAVVELALERKPESVNLGDFDAAMLRRWFPGADDTLRNRLSRGDEAGRN